MPRLYRQQEQKVACDEQDALWLAAGSLLRTAHGLCRGWRGSALAARGAGRPGPECGVAGCDAGRRAAGGSGRAWRGAAVRQQRQALAPGHGRTGQCQPDRSAVRRRTARLGGWPCRRGAAQRGCWRALDLAARWQACRCPRTTGGRGVSRPTAVVCRATVAGRWRRQAAAGAELRRCPTRHGRRRLRAGPEYPGRRPHLEFEHGAAAE